MACSMAKWLPSAVALIDSKKMEEDSKTISCPILVCQINNMPDEGVDLEGEVPFAEIDIQSDFRFDLSNSNLHFKLHLAAAKQDIIVTGHLWAEVSALCDRCAEMAPLLLDTNDVFHTYKNILGEPIDLTEGIREDILITFPQSFHCRPDCKGLCPSCGANLNEGDCGCGNKKDNDDKEDPWKALSGLKL